jgi:hypothetical protein
MRGVYLVPPMEEDPPAAFVDFVRVQLAGLYREAGRLTNGRADEVYPEALADVAGHWRRLSLRRRLTNRDTPGAYLTRRLVKRAAQWREQQIYQVEMQLFRPPIDRPESVALRKATLIPGTERHHARPVAEATIAWAHACRRARRNRWARTGATLVLLSVALAQSVPPVPTGF